VWITPKRLLHCLAHVGVPGRQANPRGTRGRDHRRRLPLVSAFIDKLKFDNTRGARR
jgi:hypothetical protein